MYPLSEIALAWLRSEPRARLFTDTKRELVWANDRGRQRLEKGDGLTVIESRLAVTGSADQTPLEDFLRSCGPTQKTMVLSSLKDEIKLVLEGQQLAKVNGSKIVGLAFHLTGDDDRVRYADIRSIYSLSDSEEAVLMLLMSGRNVREIMRLREVSEETVRSQVKNLYRKLSVSTREKMFSLVSKFRI